MSTADGTQSARTAVLLDPYPLWFDAVEEVLARIPVAVVGKATEPGAALELIERHQPDLFVAETQCPRSEIDGITCLRLARTTHPELTIVVLSVSGEQHEIDASFAAGAAAYAVKTASPDDLAAAVRQSFERSIFLAAKLPEPARPAPAADGEPIELTRRELEVLRLVAEGYANAAVAKMLWVTEQTVKFHLSNIYRKLGVSNRTEASRWAQLNSVLPPFVRVVSAPAGARASPTTPS